MLIPQIHLLGTRGVSVLKKNIHMNDARVHRLTFTVSCVCMCVLVCVCVKVNRRRRGWGGWDRAGKLVWLRDVPSEGEVFLCTERREGKGEGNELRSSTKGLLPMWQHGCGGSQGDTLEPKARFWGIYLVLKPNICAVRALLLTADKVVSPSYLSHPWLVLKSSVN